MANSESSKPKSFLEVPSSFFDGARVYSFGDFNCIQAAPFTQSLSEKVASQQYTVAQGSLNRWVCNTCTSLEFGSLDEQRSHFKSDFHRMNIKRKLVGRQPLCEEEFEVLAQGQHKKDDDVSSISGSGEDSSAGDESGDEHESRHTLASKTASYNSISLQLQNFKEIATFWKCVVLRDSEKLCKHGAKLSLESGGFVTEDALLERLKRFTRRDVPDEPNLWVIVLSRGGHFAGCVFDTKKGSILAHKTYHRYVVRAKAGGKQSTKDGTGRAPKSAGASLRRHNEASLERDVRELLASWKGYLETASSIFVHAPSRNSHALFGGEDAPLRRSDQRVYNVPISTRRPTYKEAKRIFNELITITYENLESINIATSSLKPSTRKLSGALNADVGKDDLSGNNNTIAVAFSNPDRKQGENLGGDVESEDLKQDSDASPLHYAAKSGDVDLVMELLQKGANPCARDDRGRTPYTLASDRETRNAFRRFMASNLELWDWHAANVPSALTVEIEAAQAIKQAEKDAKRKAKAKEQKKMRKEKLKARELASAANERDLEASEKAKQDLSSTSSAAAKKKAEAAEREKRALAAEKRIAAMSNGGSMPSSSLGTQKQDGPCCSFCGVSLVGTTPFHRLSFQYCTTVCVNAHRLALECGD